MNVPGEGVQGLRLGNGFKRPLVRLLKNSGSVAALQDGFEGLRFENSLAG